jgi:hypothetical protein
MKNHELITDTSDQGVNDYLIKHLFNSSHKCGMGPQILKFRRQPSHCELWYLCDGPCTMDSLDQHSDSIQKSGPEIRDLQIRFAEQLKEHRV